MGGIRLIIVIYLSRISLIILYAFSDNKVRK